MSTKLGPKGNISFIKFLLIRCVWSQPSVLTSTKVYSTYGSQVVSHPGPALLESQAQMRLCTSRLAVLFCVVPAPSGQLHRSPAVRSSPVGILSLGFFQGLHPPGKLWRGLWKYHHFQHPQWQCRGSGLACLPFSYTSNLLHLRFQLRNIAHTSMHACMGKLQAPFHAEESRSTLTGSSSWA